MLFEVEDEQRDFVTIYKKDYTERKPRKLKEIRPLPPFPPPLNILNGPYKRCLNTRDQNTADFLSAVREKRCWLKKTLPETVPDENFLERKEKDSKKTIYHLDYCDAPWIRIRRPVKKPIILPEGWVIPETVQKTSYRNPRAIATESLIRVERMTKPPDNLTPNPKEREILRVRTGDTEYNNKIETTAYRMMNGNEVGVPLPIKFQSDYEENPEPIKPSENIALPSRVF